MFLSVKSYLVGWRVVLVLVLICAVLGVGAV